MADPFEALRAPEVPTDPDPGFANRLRARIQLALEPRGFPVSTQIRERQVPKAPAPIAGVIPYLAVADARRALAWYGDALGARPRGEPIAMPDGRIGHAELEIADHVLMLSDEFPEIGLVAPEPGRGAAVTLHLTVDDVDAVTTRAVDAGAHLERPPADHPYGRNAVVRDPFGHRWMVASSEAAMPAGEQAPSSERERPGPQSGDLSYVSLWVPDVERAATFFGAVLGWTYAPGGGQGRHVEGVTPRHGLWGGQERSTLFLCFATDDVEAAAARVEAAGGSAGAPRDEPYGLVADCVDDQGLAFALVQSPSGHEDAGTTTTGDRPGDLAYVVMEMADSARGRAFYSSVLGWRFSTGRVPDGWSVEDVAPPVGILGGQDRATIVPMYSVGDIAVAVERVRTAGGTATDPERQPYGVSSYCTDDQGTRFYLGEL
ncbi:MAG: VOC family protein [Acidimicrobiales bacterium]